MIQIETFKSTRKKIIGYSIQLLTGMSHCVCMERCLMLHRDVACGIEAMLLESWNILTFRLVASNVASRFHLFGVNRSVKAHLSFLV